jgi:hypothetical protein
MLRSIGRRLSPTRAISAEIGGEPAKFVMKAPEPAENSQFLKKTQPNLGVGGRGLFALLNLVND